MTIELSLDTPSSLPASSARSWQGHLALEFAQRSDRTILSRSQVQAPLKVQRPFYPEDDQSCHAVMLHTAGGIVGGDRLSISVQLQPGAQALVTSAAATKVYRTNGLEAQQQVQIQVGEGACLEWLPQETIVFDGALYRQQFKIELAAGATWIGWDLTRLGRSARGEQFDGGEWRSRTEVWQNDRLIWVDPQWIQGGSDMMTSLHGLASCPVIGTFVLMGPQIPKELIEELRSQITLPQLSLTRLQAGLLCRYRGDSTTEAKRALIKLWQLLRQEFLGRSVSVPRVWQL